MPTHLSLEVRLSLDLPLLLEPVDDVLVAPSDLVRHSLQGAVLTSATSRQEASISAHLSSGLESEDSESGGDNDTLDLVLRWRDTLVQLQSLKRGGTSGGLVRDHSSDGLVQDPGRGSEVEGTSSSRVDNVSL